jgi:FlaA1/EpsC-like NDP-sugar epimerase
MIARKILKLPRYLKRLIIISVDLVLLPFALWVSFSLRLGDFYVPEGNIKYLFLVVSFIAAPIFIRLGLYRAIIRYIGFFAMWAVIKAVSLYTLVWGVIVAKWRSRRSSFGFTH